MLVQVKKNQNIVSFPRNLLIVYFLVPVSKAKTLLRFSTPEAGVLSFAANQDIKIFSKEAGSVTSLWGAEINGKRGYVPKHLVREYKILNKPTKLVNTKVAEEPQVPKTSDDVKPDKPLEPFEIIDGTKLYLNPSDEVKSIDTTG